jgi:hypothetical protein
MKIFLIIFCLIPLTAFANPLPHTKWIDESASKCPTAIFFGVKKYIFINRCFARGSDGVVEKGNYAVSGKNLMLANRRFSTSGNFVFVPPQLKSLPIISLSKDRLVLDIAGKTWRFRRVTRGPAKQEMNKSKNKPIKYSPPWQDAPNARAAFY